MNWVTLTSRGHAALPCDLSLFFEGAPSERWTMRATLEGESAAAFPAFPTATLEPGTFEQFGFLPLGRERLVLTVIEQASARSLRIPLPVDRRMSNETSRVLIPSISLEAGSEPSTWIAVPLSLSGDPEVSLEVVDAAGHPVRVWGPHIFPPGRTTILWDGKDDAGAAVPHGGYEVRVRDEHGGVLARERAVVS